MVEERLTVYSVITNAHSMPQIRCHRLQRTLQSPTARGPGFSSPAQHTLVYGVPASLLHHTVGKGFKASSPNPKCLARCLAQSNQCWVNVVA